MTRASDLAKLIAAGGTIVDGDIIANLNGEE